MFEVITMNGKVLKRVPEKKVGTCTGCYWVNDELSTTHCNAGMCGDLEFEYGDNAVLKQHIKLGDTTCYQKN